MKRLVVTVLLVSLPFMWASSAPAQDGEISASPASASYLPAVSDIGVEWTEVRQYGLDVPTDIFREGAGAVYAGPDGSRIVVLVYLTTDSRVAVRQSWEEATSVFDSYRYNVASNYDWDQRDRLEAMAPPEGCIESKRAEGTDNQFGFLAGITMCAIDPDVIIIAVSSGSALELSGYQASDAVVGLAIAAAE